VPPCHRDEKAEVDLGDNGGRAGGNPVVGGRGQSVANGVATDKLQRCNGKSSSVARWQCLSGGYDDLTIPPERDWRDRLALEVKDVDQGGNQLHFPFRETSIPPILDRPNEPPCAQCGLPGGTECAYDGLTIRLHSHCQRAWMVAYEAGGYGTGARRP
jgi:hypothetical protein